MLLLNACHYFGFLLIGVQIFASNERLLVRIGEDAVFYTTIFLFITILFFRILSSVIELFDNPEQNN